MSFCTKKVYALVLAGLVFLLVSSVLSWGAEGEPIGAITAIEGEVWLGHKGEKALCPAMLGDAVYLKNRIQTEKASRVQILFQDESLLNLTENTTIQILKYIYSPKENRRFAIIQVLMGRVRGIVGRHFTGPGSSYIISTPTDIIEIEHDHFVVDAVAGRIR